MAQCPVPAMPPPSPIGRKLTPEEVDEFLTQWDDPSLRAPIFGPSPHHVRRFVQRWKYTIGLCLGTAAATGLMLITEPANWWVPLAFVAVMLVVCWPGWHRRR